MRLKAYMLYSKKKKKRRELAEVAKVKLEKETELQIEKNKVEIAKVAKADKQRKSSVAFVHLRQAEFQQAKLEDPTMSKGHRADITAIVANRIDRAEALLGYEVTNIEKAIADIKSGS